MKYCFIAVLLLNRLIFTVSRKSLRFIVQHRTLVSCVDSAGSGSRRVGFRQLCIVHQASLPDSCGKSE
jgi:hypothetical protein